MRKPQKGWQDLAWVIMEALAAIVAIVIIYSFVGYMDAKAAEPTRAQLEIHAAKTEIAFELPDGLLRAVCDQESNWRNVAGQHGEIGVCQLKPGTVLMVCDCADNTGRVYLGRGATGDAVRRVQAQLARWGFYTTPDGIYGPDTRSQVTAFQKALSATADGVVGPKTWALLFRGTEPYPGGTITAALWDPYKNIEWAAAYLVWLAEYLETDNPAILMAAYNGGPGNPVVKYMVSVQRRMARGSM